MNALVTRDLDDLDSGPWPRVLVAEPRAALRAQIGLALCRAGMEVSFAASVGEALDLASEGDFHVAVLDPAMEAGSGLDLCRHLARGTRGPCVAVVALCARPGLLTRVRAFLAGARACLARPLAQEQFVGAVRRCARRRPGEPAAHVRTS